MSEAAADTHIGHLHRGSISATTQWSIDAVLLAEPSVSRAVIRGEAEPDAGGGRNRIIQAFLMTSSTWLLLLDDGVGFGGDALSLLRSVAEPESRPVVSALGFKASPVGISPEFGLRHRIHPAAYEWVVRDDRAGYVELGPELPADSLFECDSVDPFCLLIHRDILSRMADAHGSNWFSPARHPVGGVQLRDGEAFSCRLTELGVPLRVAAEVRVAHEYTIYLDEEIWLAENADEEGGARPLGAHLHNHPDPVAGS